MLDSPAHLRFTKAVFLLVAIAILLTAFWLRIDRLDRLPPGLTADEAINVVDGFYIGKTGRFPLYEDPYRPEPVFRIVYATIAFIFGPHIWIFRFSIALWVGTSTVATIWRAMIECVPDLPPWQRRLAATAAAGTLAVAVGPVTLQRTVYRANLQPLFMALFVVFLLRGVQRGKQRDFLMAGLLLAGVMHSYLAGLVVPLALVPLVLSLLVFQRTRWRAWLRNLVLLLVVLALLTAPVTYYLLTDPVRILGRVTQVEGGTLTLEKRVKLVWQQFVTTGDINPQYNVESAPLIPRGFMPLFILGLVALMVRLRQPSSALIGAMLVLSAIPVMASNEIPHGLRIIGAFAVFPLVIGLGTALILSAISALPAYSQARQALHYGMATVLALLLAADARYAQQTYRRYWDKPYTWAILGRDLPHGLWFFRTDRRDFANWIEQQDRPLLVPVEALALQTTRAWLLDSYPEVRTGDETIKLPADTVLVVPWVLEIADLMRDTRHYALLHNATITLLAPLAVETHQQLLAGIDGATEVYQANGDLMVRYRAIPNGVPIAFEPRTITSTADKPLPVYDADVQLVGWRGPDTLQSLDSAQVVNYTLDFRARRPLWHYYEGYVAFQTQALDRKAWQYADLWRWLYPPTAWTPEDTISRMFTLTLPANLEPGAYRLVVGMALVAFEDRLLQASSVDGTPLGREVTVGWIKVPQLQQPVIPPDARLYDATIADAIALRSAEFVPGEAGTVEVVLTWQALVERPDFDATIFVHALLPDGTIFAQDDSRPWGGQYPTFIWDQDELVQTRHILSNVQQQNELRITAGMYTFPGVVRLAVQQNGEPAPGDVIALGQLMQLLSD